MAPRGFRHNAPFRCPDAPHSPFRPPRPRLTGHIALYALTNVFSLSCVAIGGSWFVAGQGAIIAGFPGSLVEAMACTAGGGGVMLWAVARILREWRKPGTEMRERYAARHPDELPNNGD